jgi:ABC-type multidrug transport system fused ATPase/permease subunit
MNGVDACGRFWSWEAVGPLQMGKTIVTIAYQFSSAKRPDQTLALEGGEIMEWGAHGERLDPWWCYPELLQRQGRQGATLDGVIAVES